MKTDRLRIFKMSSPSALAVLLGAGEDDSSLLGDGTRVLTRTMKLTCGEQP